MIGPRAALLLTIAFALAVFVFAAFGWRSHRAAHKPYPEGRRARAERNQALAAAVDYGAAVYMVEQRISDGIWP